MRRVTDVIDHETLFDNFLIGREWATAMDVYAVSRKRDRRLEKVVEAWIVKIACMKLDGFHSGRSVRKVLFSFS